MTFPRYLSVKEVAAVLNVKDKTVYKKNKLGELPGHFQLGSMHFFDEEELRKGLKTLATTPKKTASKFYQTSKDPHGLRK